MSKIRIESLDVLDSQRKLREIEQMDLQEHTRMATTYLKINQIIHNISDLDVFPALVWVECWDMVKNKLESYDGSSGEDYITNDKFTEEDVWWMFVQDCDKNNFNTDYGSEALSESIFDWMIDRDILVVLQDDAWLDDETATLDGPWESMDPK